MNSNGTVPVNRHSENYILTKLRICYLLHIIKYHEDKRLKEEYIKRLPKHEQEKIRQLKIDKFERELEEMIRDCERSGSYEQ